MENVLKSIIELRTEDLPYPVEIQSALYHGGVSLKMSGRVILFLCTFRLNVKAR